MTHMRVLKPGLLTTVQDLGRDGFAQLGLSAGGAADALSLRVANLIVGNDANAAGLEMTLLGASLEFESDAVVALTGAQAKCTVRSSDGSAELAPHWQVFKMCAGHRLDCGATTLGARVYLAIAGGIDVPQVLGSRATSLAAGIGGFEGRALREGDVLSVGELQGSPRALRDDAYDSIFRTSTAPATEIRVTRGAQFDWFSAESVARFFSCEYTVSEYSNRNGVRLKGGAIPPSDGRQLLTEGVSLGAVQVPPDGQPIILFVDQQTTGGYPKIANVISADMHRVGQLKPQDSVCFCEVTLTEAIGALRAQRRWLQEAFLP